MAEKQQVIVDNRPGAGGTLGAEIGAKSPPDGYTFTVIAGSYAVNPAIYKLAFDPVNDITPVIQFSEGPLLVVVHPALPIKNMKDMIALAKAKPNGMSFASSGQGSIVHLATELFLYTAGIKGYDVVLWHGLVGPKGLPRPIVDRVNAELNKALKANDMVDKLAADGVSPAGGTPEQFGATIY